MNRFGRPLKLSALDQGRFVEMYRNPRILNAEICWAFEISKPTIKDYAVRLGLPRRAPDKSTGRTRDTTKWKASYAATRERIEEEQHLALLNAVDKPINAKWWRCDHCQGRSTDRLGHELCQNRKAAA